MSDQATQTSECAQAGALVDKHKLLEPFVGNFTAEVKMWMGPGDPMISTGVMVNKLDLGGRFLHEVFTGDPNDGPFPSFEGRGYWGYNTATNKFEGFWIDNACTFMQTETGDVDAAGKVWTMVGQMTDPQSGKPLEKRSVITLESNDRHTMEMYFKPADGRESKAMEIHYTRER